MFKAKQPVTESEAKELALDSYVTYIHTQYCITCGAVETFSQCYEVWLHPTKTRNSNLRDLRPAGKTLKPIPMAKLAIPIKHIPICARCVDNYKAPTPVQTTNAADWEATLRRKYEPAPAEPKVATKSAKPAKHIPTLDQI